MWNQELIQLNYRLAELYTDTDSTKTLVKHADIEAINLEVSFKPFQYWYNVLKAAQEQGKLDELVTRALVDHPEDKKLLAIQANILDDTGEMNELVQKEFCQDLIQNNEFYEAVPFVASLAERSNLSFDADVDLANSFAKLVQLQQLNTSGKRKKKQANRLEQAKNELILKLQAL